MTKECKKGFSLIEVLLGTAAFSLLALIIGTVLVLGWKSWSHNKAEVETQRGLTLSYAMLSREIRACSMTNIVISTDRISFQDNSTSVRREGDRLVHYNAANQPMILMDGKVADLSSVVVTNGAQFVDVSLDYKTARGTTASQRYMIHARN